MEPVKLPLPDQIKRLNCRSSDIHTMEMGCDLLRATYQHFGHASFSKLAMFPFFVKNLMNSLIDFNVLGASLFKGKMEVLAQWAKEVLEI
ncbi:hypothetical protein AMTRI_Chr09g18580 [Amborella trichopoda]